MGIRHHWQASLDELAAQPGVEVPAIIGVDPDTHDCSFASVVYDSTIRSYTLQWAVVVKTPSKLTGAHAVAAMVEALNWLEVPYPGNLFVVEDQLVRKGKTPNPQNLVPLAQVAGACMSLAHREHTPATLVQAHDWKGTQSKLVNQSRTCEALGIPYSKRKLASGKGYCVANVEPDECYAVTSWSSRKSVLPSDWHHLLDAAGIALWAQKKLQMAKAKQAVRRSR